VESFQGRSRTEIERLEMGHDNQRKGKRGGKSKRGSCTRYENQAKFRVLRFTDGRLKLGGRHEGGKKCLPEGTRGSSNAFVGWGVKTMWRTNDNGGEGKPGKRV